jgi:hypothetical protein
MASLKAMAAHYFFHELEGKLQVLKHPFQAFTGAGARLSSIS